MAGLSDQDSVLLVLLSFFIITECVLLSSAMARNKQKVVKKSVARSKSGRILKKPVEIYHQNCVMMATVRGNGRKKERARIKNVEKQRRFQAKKKEKKVEEQQAQIKKAKKKTK